jgi:hypothetical protein
VRCTHVASAVESVVETTVGNLDEVILDLRALGELRGVNKIGSTELASPGLLVGIGIDGDDAGRLNELGSGDHTKTNCTATEDSNGRTS